MPKQFRTVCHPPSELAPLMSDLVRVGREADGGYLVPVNALDDATGCLSLGLGVDWSFESAFYNLKRKSIGRVAITFFDSSISILGILKNLKYMTLRTYSEIFSKGLPKSERKYKLEDLKRLLIGLISYLPVFKLQRKFIHIRKHVVHFPRSKFECSFSDAMGVRIDPKSTIVKIDIEGGEWDLLREARDVAQLADAPVLIVEFHDTRRPEFMKVVSMIKEFFWIAHLHGNSSDRATEAGMPLYLEMTFVNKRYSPGDGIRRKLPIDGLDFPTRPGELPHEFEFNN